MKFGLGFFPTAEAIPPGELGRLVEERGHESLFFAEHTHIPAARHSPWPAGGELPPKYARMYGLYGSRRGDHSPPYRQWHLPMRLGAGYPRTRMTPHAVAGSPPTASRVATTTRFARVRRPARPATPPRTRPAPSKPRVERDPITTAARPSTLRAVTSSFERIWSWPKPAQRPHPPILVGGNGPTVIDRVLRFGDAWFPSYGDREGFERKLADLRARAERPIEVQVISAPADPAKLEQLAELGVSRAAHWLPSGQLSAVEPALERWEKAIAQLHGEA